MLACGVDASSAQDQQRRYLLQYFIAILVDRSGSLHAIIALLLVPLFSLCFGNEHRRLLFLSGRFRFRNVAFVQRIL